MTVYTRDPNRILIDTNIGNVQAWSAPAQRRDNLREVRIFRQMRRHRHRPLGEQRVHDLILR